MKFDDFLTVYGQGPLSVPDSPVHPVRSPSWTHVGQQVRRCLPSGLPYGGIFYPRRPPGRYLTNLFFKKINKHKTTICLTGANECPFPDTDQNNNVVRNVSKVYDSDLIDLTSFGK